MMQIQPSDNWIELHDATTSQDARRRKVTPADAVINELDSGFASFVQTAINAESLHTEAVTAAKKALNDGTLDTPEVYLKAAQNLIIYGL
jgi:hypothetical protein